MKPLKALKNFLGLDAGEEPQPEENHFSFPLLYSFIPLTMVLLQTVSLVLAPLAYEGVPSDLYLYNPHLNGGRLWLSAEGLSPLTQALAWFILAWKLSVYGTVAIFFFRTAKAFHRKASFTYQFLRFISCASLLVLVSIFGINLLTGTLAKQVQEDLALSQLNRPDLISSEWGITMTLIAASLLLIEGFLHRGLTLQEESDSTI